MKYIIIFCLLLVSCSSQSMVIYQVVVDRFADGTNTSSAPGYYGGDLVGIIDQLDYIEKLGGNTILLTPIFNASSYHGYDVVDYYEIEEHFGTYQDFRDLVDQVHKREMKIILDIPINHMSSEFSRYVEDFNYTKSETCVRKHTNQYNLVFNDDFLNHLLMNLFFIVVDGILCRCFQIIHIISMVILIQLC